MLTDQQIDEFLDLLAKSPTSARDMVRGLFAAHEAKAAPAAPKCVVVDRGFRWESEALQHVPRLVIEFEPVPINSPINAKGWMDRDALADMIAASSQEPAAPSQPAVPQGEPVEGAYLQVYRCKIKSRRQIMKEIPRERQGWWTDVSAGQTLNLRQATHADLARCSLNEDKSKDPNHYMCETFERGSLVSKEALEYMHPEQNVFACVTAAPSQEPDLHIGVCITDGVLHATVMRREANGHVTTLATAEMDAASLVGYDGIAKMSPAAPSQEPVTLTESERVRCLIKAGCIGTVKMTYDSGPYEITRTSINADRLIEAIIAALREKEGK